MIAVRHREVEQTRGYRSRIFNRQLIAADAEPPELWEQVIPVGGYIVRHRHAYTEILVLLSGRTWVCADGVESEWGPDTTLVLEPGCVHELRNVGDEDVRLLAIHTHKAALDYPDGPPQAVDWSARGPG